MGQESTAQPDHRIDSSSPAAHGPAGFDLRKLAKWHVIMVALAFALTAILSPRIGITWFLIRRQDCWLLLAETALLLAAARFVQARVKPLAGGLGLYGALFGLMALAALAGHYLVLAGYDLCRDEQMANFDAAVFAGGHLVEKLPAMWRDSGEALNTRFMYTAEHRGAWISAYLPMNAALRALFGLFASPVLVGPVMTMIGGVALWGCARRIWPEDREAAVVASLLYLASGQVLFAGMTAYAMPAHAALNLVWLWLWLGRSRMGDVLALAVGFVAVGLHQPLFHPMFAAPILFLLVRDREWKRAAFYALGYALIGAFWMIWWPTLTWGLVQASADAVQPEGVSYTSRLIITLMEGNFFVLPDMMANLLRFVAWQHILLVPLLVAGVAVARRNPLAGAIAAGLALTIGVMTLILSNQGYGFGYRYLHGLIGNAILLAVFGWKAMGDATPRWRGLLVGTTALGIAVTTPMQAWMAHAQYAPFAQLNAKMAASSADYLVIGKEDVTFTDDFAINAPKLDRKPVRLIRESVDPALVAAICKDHARVDLVDIALYRDIGRYMYQGPHPAARAGNAAMEKGLRDAGCLVSMIR